jgi:predicted PurR-regulated permease PerM
MVEPTQMSDLNQPQQGPESPTQSGPELVASNKEARAGDVPVRTPSPEGEGRGTPAPAVTESAHLEYRRINRLHAFAEVVIATAVVLAWLYYAKLPLIVLLVSILAAFMLAPIVDGLQRIRVPRAVGALIATVVFLAALYVIFWAGYNRAASFIHDLPKYSGEIRRVVIHVRQKAEKIQKTTEGAINGPAEKSKPNEIQIPALSQVVTQNFGSVTEMAFIVSFIPFLVYFMLSWQEHARSATVKLFRMENRSTAYVTVGLISSMIRSFIVGNVIVGLFMSGISTLVFGLIGLPYFYFLGFISGFLSLVPYLGVLLAIVPPVAAGLGRVHSTEFIIIVVTVLALHLFSLNVLYPKFLGSRLQLNPLALTVALLFWGWLWGAMGLILAIPITGAIKIVFDHIDGLRAYGEWLGE